MELKFYQYFCRQEKYKVAMALYVEVMKHKKIAYIDLRFQDFIIRYVEDDDGR